jgi:hypothetical protein
MDGICDPPSQRGSGLAAYSLIRDDHIHRNVVRLGMYGLDPAAGVANADDERPLRRGGQVPSKKPPP